MSKLSLLFNYYPQVSCFILFLVFALKIHGTGERFIFRYEWYVHYIIYCNSSDEPTQLCYPPQSEFCDLQYQEEEML